MLNRGATAPRREDFFPRGPQYSRMTVRRGRVATLLLAALLVTAGCGLPVGDGSSGNGSDGSLTAAPVPADRADYPPGITAGRVTAPDRLARAHGRAIENVSYRLRSNRSTYYPNGTLRSRLDLDLRLSRARHHRAAVRTAGPAAPVILGRPPASAVYWSNRSLYASRIERDGDTVYSLTQATSNPFATWQYWSGTAAFGGGSSYPTARYAGFFRAIPTRVVNNRTVNGTTVFELRGREARSPAFTVGPAERVEDVRLRATVTEDGLVRSLRLRYVATHEDGRYRVAWTIAYPERGGLGVGDPPWLDRAIAANRDR